MPDAAMLALTQMATNLGGTPPSAPPLIYQITGWESGKCQLKITKSSTPDEGASTTQATSITMNCAIPSADLITLSNSAKKIASGTFELSTDSPSAKTLKDNCTY